MTHCERVLEYMLQHGSITQNEATDHLACTRLSGRIYDLKHRGYSIGKLMVDGKNRFGDPTRFARYFLQEQEILHF